MRKSIALFGVAVALAIACAGGAPLSAHAEEELACKAAYLCDIGGTPVYAQAETERLPIASMCKIMTLLLSFEAVDRGELSLEEQVPVSERAAGMGGSQVFLEKGCSYPAEALMKSIAVCSANDSCVAMAERIAGSESAFVERMNGRAKELGAHDTLFANCTGLPKETQYSCAKDVATMLRALLRHRKYYEFSRVWVEDFPHPDGRTTQMTNTNKLIRFYEGCDGGKTGFTNEAGFCLAATAKRGETRLVSVVIGAQDSKVRFGTVSSLLDRGFAEYETKTVLRAGPIGEKVPIKGSRVREIAVCAKRPLRAFCRKADGGEMRVVYEIGEQKAPVQRGDKVGCAVLYRDGVEIARTALIADEDAPKYTWWDGYRESARNWN